LKNIFKDVNENKIVIVLSYLDKNKNVKLNVTNKMKVKDAKKCLLKILELIMKNIKLDFFLKDMS
jgi:hypothetical protein